MIRCPNGHLNEDAEDFCTVCHAYLHWDSSPAPPPSPETPQEPAEPGVAAVLDPTTIAAEPGIEVTAVVRVTNTGNLVDGFAIQVSGDAAPWVIVDPPTLSLMPAAEGAATLHITPPPDGASTDAAFSVRVTSRADADSSAELTGTVHVTAKPRLTSSISPAEARVYRTSTRVVRLSNEGGQPLVVSLSVTEPSRRLSVTLDQGNVTVVPNVPASSTLVLRFPKLKVAGAAIAYPFTVDVRPADATGSQLAGTVTQRSILAGWRLLVAALVLVSVVAALGSRIVSGGTTTTQDGRTYSDIVMDDAPTAYWRLDEDPSANQAIDATGNGHDGVFQGGVKQVVPGALVQDPSPAIAFNGSDGWVKITDIPLFDFTVEAWVNLPEPMTSQDAIFGQSGPGMDINFTEGRLRLFNGDVGFTKAPWDMVTAQTSLTPDKWTYCVITRTGSTLLLYLDGELNATGYPWSDLLDLTSIGLGNAGYLDGTLDEVAVYDHALTPQQIQAHFNAR
jgi:hypothetical protein